MQNRYTFHANLGIVSYVFWSYTLYTKYMRSKNVKARGRKRIIMSIKEILYFLFIQPGFESKDPAYKD